VPLLSSSLNRFRVAEQRVDAAPVDSGRPQVAASAVTCPGPVGPLQPHSSGIYKRIDQAEEESRTLAALRAALLPKLICGQLRIADARRFVNQAY